jgi:xanthine dehydrogenase small subunit
VEAAAAALEQDFRPIDDLRGSAWYRMTVAKNLLRGFFLECRDVRVPRLSERPSGTVEVR